MIGLDPASNEQMSREMRHVESIIWYTYFRIVPSDHMCGLIRLEMDKPCITDYCILCQSPRDIPIS